VFLAGSYARTIGAQVSTLPDDNAWALGTEHRAAPFRRTLPMRSARCRRRWDRGSHREAGAWFAEGVGQIEGNSSPIVFFPFNAKRRLSVERRTAKTLRPLADELDAIA